MNGTLGEPRIRTIDRRAASGVVEESACSVQGCTRATSNRKPYCIAHLDRLAYVRQVRHALESLEADARRSRSIDADGPIGREIVRVLQGGARSFESVARELGVTVDAVAAHAAVLARTGALRVVTIHPARGGTKNMLVPASFALRAAV